MNLENLTHADFPFNHWVFSNCLEEGALDEISYSNIPSGDRMYDGTRAADHTGQGVDGKLRLFITKNNCQNFPYLTKLIQSLQSKERDVPEYIQLDDKNKTITGSNWR